MNERIRELAEQASLYAVSDNSSMLFDVWKERYTEKFAELIIRECYEWAKENGGLGTEYDYNALKEHLRVEE